MTCPGSCEVGVVPRPQVGGEWPSLIWWESGPNGECNLLSGGWCVFTGQTFEDARRFGWMAAVHPTHRDRLLAIVFRARANAEAFRCEYPLRRADGVYRWVVDVGVPMGAGWYTGFLTDITEQREREADSADARAARSPPTLSVAPEYVTIPEAAATLGVSPAHLYRLLRADPSLGVRLGRSVRVHLVQLQRSLERRR